MSTYPIDVDAHAVDLGQPEPSDSDGSSSRLRRHVWCVVVCSALGFWAVVSVGCVAWVTAGVPVTPRPRADPRGHRDHGYRECRQVWSGDPRRAGVVRLAPCGGRQCPRPAHELDRRAPKWSTVIAGAWCRSRTTRAATLPRRRPRSMGSTSPLVRSECGTSPSASSSAPRRTVCSHAPFRCSTPVIAHDGDHYDDLRPRPSLPSGPLR